MVSVRTYCQIRSNKIYKDGKLVAGFTDLSLDDFLLKAYDHFQLNYPKYYKMDRQSKLGLLASEILLKGLDRATNTSVVLSNASSSLDTDIKFWASVKTQASPSLFVYTLPNIVAGEICIRNSFKGESIFFITSQFDAEQTVSYVNIISKEEQGDCVAGWVEVLNDDTEVFLYLAGQSPNGLPHTTEKISELYQTWKN